jgi:hypothetical protein
MAVKKSETRGFFNEHLYGRYDGRFSQEELGALMDAYARLLTTADPDGEPPTNVVVWQEAQKWLDRLVFDVYRIGLDAQERNYIERKFKRREAAKRSPTIKLRDDES